MHRRTDFQFSSSSASAALAAQSSKIPTPESVIGFAPGAESKLATYDQTIDYFKKLDAASDQMTLVEAGTSTQGRTFYFALISSKDNLKKIDRYREIARRLARPEGLSEAQALALAREGKPLVHIDGGLHSTEVAGPQHTLLLAHDLLAKPSDPQVARILDNVILMLWPTINPDGHQMVADWYMKNVGTPNEIAAAPLPGIRRPRQQPRRLHAQHDRVARHRARVAAVGAADHLRAAPVVAVSDPHLAAAVRRADRDARAVPDVARGQHHRHGDRAGTRGARPGRRHPHGHRLRRVVRRLHRLHADVQEHRVVLDRDGAGRHGEHARIQDRCLSAGVPDLRPQALYTSPWAPGKWTLRDAVDYMETASLSVLDYAARYKENVLLNRYRSGKWQIEKHRKEGPFAYCHSAGSARQGRPRSRCCAGSRSAAFASSQLTAPITVEGETFPAGTWVIPTDQEFIALAREVLDPQVYPDLREFDGGPPEQPYDAAGLDAADDDGRAGGDGDEADRAMRDRAKFKMLAADAPLAGEADAVHRGEDGRGGVRQRARRRASTRSPMAAAIVPPAVSLTGNRRAPLDQSGGDERVPRHQRRVEGERHGQPRRRSLRDQRHERRRAWPSSPTSLAINGERVAACRHGDHASRASRCSSRRTAWTPAGRSGCSSATASSSRASTRLTSPATFADKFDVHRRRRRAPRRAARRRLRPARRDHAVGGRRSAHQGARRVREKRRHAGRDERQRRGGDRSTEAAGDATSSTASAASSSSRADR